MAAESAPWSAIRINERHVDAATRISGTQAVRSLPVGDYLRGGTNRLALLSWASLPSPAAIAALELRFDDGSIQRIPSGQAWRCCALTIAEAREGNWEAKLDDSTACVEYCAFGAEPWDDQRARLDHPMPPVVLRRTFELPSRPIASATVTATAIGVYDMEINGRRVGDDYLAPGWTNPQKAARVQTYDAANLLVPGTNVWSATVAKGWVGSPMLGCEPTREDEKSFRAELVVRYADGETLSLPTNAEGW